MEENTTTATPEDDLRSSLEEAFDEKAPEPEQNEPEAPSESEKPAEEPAAEAKPEEKSAKEAKNKSLKEEIDENSSKSESKDEKKPFVEVEKPNQPPKDKDFKDVEAKDENESAYNVEKAPAGWKPTVREHWEGLPDDVKQEVMKREREIDDRLRETAQARQFAQAVQQTLQPYQHFLKAENATPVQAIDNLMGTAAALRTGNAEQVAQLVTEITNQFGINRFGKEMFIKKLDEKLSGSQPAPESPEIAALKQQYEQELAPLKQMQQQMAQQQQYAYQQSQQATEAEVQQFSSKAEFLDDVRMEMADLMDLAAQKGKELTLQEAYDRACWANPEIRAVLTRRQQTEQAQQVNETAQKAKRAAVSVNGSAPPAHTQAPGGTGSIRDDLEFAMSRLSK